jgi:hypothetical protein
VGSGDVFERCCSADPAGSVRLFHLHPAELEGRGGDGRGAEGSWHVDDDRLKVEGVALVTVDADGTTAVSETG